MTIRRWTMLLGATALVAATVVTTEGHAFVWPNEAQRILRDLSAKDVEVRRAAASSLSRLRSEAAFPLIKQALLDEDVAVREAALKSAAFHPSEEISEVLGGWLSDTDSSVRLSALQVIALAPSPRGLEALGRALGDASPEVRRIAAVALGRVDSTDALGLLMGHIDDSSPEVRVAVTIGLGRHGDPRGVLPLLAKIQDAAPDVRRQAARALGILRDPRGESALLAALSDPQLDVRLEAARALGRLGTESAVRGLRPLVALESVGAAVPSESTSALRRAAIEALGEIGNPPAIDALISALEGDRAEFGRGLARRVLGSQTGDRRGAAKAALIAKLDEGPSPRVAEGIVGALGDLADPEAGEAIGRAMDAGIVPADRALRALGQVGGETAKSVCIERLTDRSIDVRRRAAESLLKLLDPRRPDGRVVLPIEKAFERSDLDRGDRASLVHLLGRSGSPSALPLLTRLATSGDSALRLSALSALSGLPSGDGASDELLLLAIDDARGDVRFEAARALGKIGSPGQIKTLLARLAGASPVDELAYGLALSRLLARTRDAEAWQAALETLPVAGPKLRDGLIEGLAESPVAQAVRLLEAVRADPQDRRKLAESTSDLASIRALARDSDASVRAAALWSLGALGEASDLELLRAARSDLAAAPAANAYGALGQWALRNPTADTAELFCAGTGDARASVAANAFAAAASVGAACDEEVGISGLRGDRDEQVRQRAARWLRGRSDSLAVRKALDRCRDDETSDAVASACAAAPVRPSDEVTPLLTFVMSDGDERGAGARPYALAFENGLIRVGTSDRRGAVFTARAPVGLIHLVAPTF